MPDGVGKFKFIKENIRAFESLWKWNMMRARRICKKRQLMKKKRIFYKELNEIKDYLYETFLVYYSNLSLHVNMIFLFMKKYNTFGHDIRESISQMEQLIHIFVEPKR